MFPLGDAHVHTAADVLTGKATVGQRVVIVGAGLEAVKQRCGCASRAGRHAGRGPGQTLAVNGPLCHANSEMLEALLPYKKSLWSPMPPVRSFENGRVLVQTPQGEQTLLADDVILCVGYREQNDLYHQLEFDVADLHLVGDARKVANIMYAIWDAFEVANHL